MGLAVCGSVADTGRLSRDYVKSLGLTGGASTILGSSMKTAARTAKARIDWLDYPSLSLIRRVTVGQTSRGVPYTSEGMAIRGDRVFLLPEDSPSRLFQFSFVTPAVQVKK
jgi:hypothetical protein